VARKSRTFFLHGAREAGIDLSPSLLATVKMRSDGTNRGSRSRPRYPRSGSGPRRDHHRAAGSPPAEIAATASHRAPLLSERLVAELDVRQMTEVQQRAFWTILKFLKELGR
jgi:hypothetical protein